MRRRKPKDPNKVALREVPTRALREVMVYMVAEVEACDADFYEEHRPGFVALANVCARELRRRGHRVRLYLPTPPEGS